ncbi:hypothetical protein HC891_23120 [Candidatus Gracilibacteria bacterium]|nr:hypothetical protein [Candidatus Gracilibacteria bacterium]
MLALLKLKRVDTTAPALQARIEALQQCVEFLYVAQASGSSVEATARLQHAADLGVGARALRHMVEHKIGDHRVESGVGKGQLLHIASCKAELCGPNKVLARGGQHAVRQITQYNLPTPRHTRHIQLPQRPGARADLKDLRRFW